MQDEQYLQLNNYTKKITNNINFIYMVEIKIYKHGNLCQFLKDS